MNTPRLHSWALPVLAALTLLANPLCPARAETPDKTGPDKTLEVKTVRDVAYYEGEDADKVKHKLDMYLPKDVKDFPIVFFVHGGAWMHGDKSGFLGLYSTFGLRLAQKGIGAVVTNYRLSPKVKHPEHIKDVARAFAWVHKHIGTYGGDPNNMFVCGHSAGGHLVALLATDESYLKANNLTLKAIRGAMPISGVMDINKDMLPLVFGKDAEVCKLASPVHHAHAGQPPFLVFYADKDLSVCSKTSAEFCKVLKEKKYPCEEMEVQKRNHMSIMLNANVDGDPVSTAMLKFIETNKQPLKQPKPPPSSGAQGK